MPAKHLFRSKNIKQKSVYAKYMRDVTMQTMRWSAFFVHAHTRSTFLQFVLIFGKYCQHHMLNATIIVDGCGTYVLCFSCLTCSSTSFIQNSFAEYFQWTIKRSPNEKKTNTILPHMLYASLINFSSHIMNDAAIKKMTHKKSISFLSLAVDLKLKWMVFLYVT